jgi:hypothetical protein
MASWHGFTFPSQKGMSLLVKQEITSLFLDEVFGAGFYYTLWHVTL